MEPEFKITSSTCYAYDGETGRRLGGAHNMRWVDLKAAAQAHARRTGHTVNLLREDVIVATANSEY